MADRHLIIRPMGGDNFHVYLTGADGEQFLGRMEYGTIDTDGQYEQDDDEIIEAAMSEFGGDSGEVK